MKEASSLSHAYTIGLEIARFEIEVEKGTQATKKTYYLALFNDLLSNNIPKEEVVRKAHEIIEKALQTITKDLNRRFTNDSWFYEIAKSQKLLDESAVTDNGNSSDSVPELSGECVRERLEYIEFMDDIIKRLQANKDILKESYYYDLDEHGNEIELKLNWSGFFEQEGKDEIMKLLKDVFYNELKEWQQMVDTRQAIIPRMRFFVAAFEGVVTNQDFCDDYYGLVKNKMRITPKKRTQYANDIYTAGKVAGLPANSKSQLFDLYKQDAFNWHFIDIPCPECGKKRMRIKLKDNGTWWFSCYNQDQHNIYETLFPATLFGDRIEQLSKNKGGAGSKFLEKNGIDVKSY